MDHIKFWEKQYRRNIDRVIGICYLYTGDRSVAEDLAQDVFVKAMDKFRSIRAVLAFDPNRPPRPCRGPLSAQQRDTLYVIEGEPVYDTLCVHDTLYRHDTITLEDHLRNPAPANKIHPQTVTFRGNPVFDSKQEKLSSMDSIFNPVNFFHF